MPKYYVAERTKPGRARIVSKHRSATAASEALPDALNPSRCSVIAISNRTARVGEIVRLTDRASLD